MEELESNAYDHRLYSRAKQIVHRQVSQSFEDPAKLRRMIGTVPEDQWMDFDTIIAVYKLGLLNDPTSIPVLAPLFSRPEDMLQEELADALATFQSDEVERAVEIHARSEDPISRSTPSQKHTANWPLPH